jgi:hypothetical protein
MIDDFPEKLSGKTKGPWNENLFKVDQSISHICYERNVSLQAWSSRYPTSNCIYGNKVTKPNEGDWKKDELPKSNQG